MTDESEDPLRTYTPEEEEALTENLRAITAAIHRGDVRDRPVDVRFVQDAHAALFRGVRDHAGHMRGRGYGQEYVIFGPQRSVHRDKVAKELEDVLQRAQRQLTALDESAGSYELGALQLAIWLHAEIVRIHPFEDGNGRTSRLCLNHVLVKCGLRPVAIEAVKQEYTETLNHYYDTRDLEPLVDLYIRLYRL